MGGDITSDFSFGGIKRNTFHVDGVGGVFGDRQGLRPE
jgi:hypothetical protein